MTPNEQSASRRPPPRLIGVSFVVLAAWVAYESVSALANRDKPDATTVGLALTALSLIVMPLLAQRKRHVAAALGSRAVAADAAQTMACVWLSGVVLIGLALNATLDWWWADPVAAVAVVVLLLNEAREALFDDHDD